MGNNLLNWCGSNLTVRELGSCGMAVIAMLNLSVLISNLER